MKYLLLIYIALFPLITFGQLNVSGSAGTGFLLVNAEGDTLHLRGQTPTYNTYRIALQDAANYNLETGEQVFIRSNMNERVAFSASEAPVDTVFLPVETAPRLIDNIEWTIIEDNPPVEQYEFVIDGQTTERSVTVQFLCGNQADGSFLHMNVDSTFTHSSQHTCSDTLTYIVSGQAGNWKTSFRDTVDIALIRSFEPGFTPDRFFTDFSDFNPEEWFVSWGNLEYSIQDQTLILDLTERSIARLHWSLIPEHRNARVRIIETLHASHGTGIHTSLRASDAPPKNALEGYMHGPGMGFSYFLDDSWGNPLDIDFAWAPGDTIEYIIETEDDELRMKVWQHGETEPEFFHVWKNVIAQVPAGGFSIGATGAGLYIIHEIEIEILD